MPSLITTCAKCSAQYGWDSDFQEYPDCPRCGYNAMKIDRAKREDCCKAAKAGDLQAVKRMLRDRDVSKNLNAGPSTILHHAVFGDQLAVAEHLLLCAASPNVSYPSANNDSALHAAASRHRIEIAKLLLDFGAKVDQKNSRGKTPADLARDANDAEMVQVLTTYQPTKREPQPEKALKAGCFIATACYGSAYCDEVNLLRVYRDEVLEGTRLGRLLVRAYYRVSPPIARWLEPRRFAKALVRRLAVAPLVWHARWRLRR